MLVAAVLGALQGVTEWLPVGSEGVVAAAYAFLLGRDPSEAVPYALFLHLGTAVSVLVVLRKEVIALILEAASLPRRPSPFLAFLVVSSVVSAVVGFPMLLFLRQVSGRPGAAAMAVVGVLILVTGAVQSRRRDEGRRGRDDVSWVDSVATGIAQGLAALPGLSRSGLTVAVLLARRVDHREALAMSFLMSIPASLGAALYGGIKEGLLTSADAAVGSLVAFLVGVVAFRVLLAVAGRVNFGAFVLGFGALVLAGAAWHTFL